MLHESLDDPVFKRMKCYDRQAPSRLENIDSARQRLFERLEFAIGRDSQRLKRSRGGMRVGTSAAPDGIAHDFGKLGGRENWRLFSFATDRARDSSRFLFLTIFEQDTGNLLLGLVINQV